MPPHVTPRPTPLPLPPGFLLLGMLLATVGVGCTLVVAGSGDVVARALFGLVAVLSLVLVEALWWVRPWVVRAVNAWAAACIGTVLFACFVAALGGLGLFTGIVMGAIAALFVGVPCALVRWYVRDRAQRLGLAP
jgi:hypothetical protein